ncbi:MAG: CPXCG motif-containing cysteine-rich protein [Cryomorphaceae bacterium]|nr:CPXCG motif-containing cysteine-rich protein [Cryomorphaceae bacterium]
MLIEHQYTCPYCFEASEIMIDPSLSRQVFIEDCSVCCNPIEFTIHLDDALIVTYLSAESIEQ